MSYLPDTSISMAQESVAGHRQRLKQRFLHGDARALTQEALLELLLTYAIPRKDVQPLARALLSRFGSLTAVLEADTASLCETKGIAKDTAALLKLAGAIHAHKSGDNGVYAPARPDQLGLFEARTPAPGPDVSPAEAPVAAPAETPAAAPKYKMQHKQRSELFSQSVLDEAIALLPKLPDTESLGVVADFLQRRMRYNSGETRRRYVSYITWRMFPEGKADAALRHFARAFAGRQELRDVCYYRFCKAEPLMFRVTDDVLMPAMARGGLERRQLRQYLDQRYPDAENVENTAKAVAKALQEAEIARVTRADITLSYREPLLPALAFVIHSEFGPGMYDLGQLERHAALRAMLWNPDRLQPALYELRNRGWLAKISEIDNVRQFTLRWTLDELVAALTGEGEGHARR